METTGEMLMGESRFVYANKIAAFCTAAAKCQFTTVASVWDFNSLVVQGKRLEGEI